MTTRYPNLNEYGITVEAHPVPTPRPVSARYPNARPATADAFLGERIVICDGIVGIVKVLRTVGDTRIVGAVAEIRTFSPEYSFVWFAVPIHPEPVAVGDGLLDWPAANGWDAVETDTPQ